MVIYVSFKQEMNSYGLTKCLIFTIVFSSRMRSRAYILLMAVSNVFQGIAVKHLLAEEELDDVRASGSSNRSTFTTDGLPQSSSSYPVLLYPLIWFCDPHFSHFHVSNVYLFFRIKILIVVCVFLVAFFVQFTDIRHNTCSFPILLYFTPHISFLTVNVLCSIYYRH